MSNTERVDLSGLWMALIIAVIVIGSQATNIAKAFATCRCEPTTQGASG